MDPLSTRPTLTSRSWRHVGAGSRASVLVSLALLAGACVGAAGPSVAPSSADPGVATSVPPAAALSVDGGDPVAGQLGPYTWGSTGTATGWLPGAPISVGDGETLLVTLDPPTDVATWSARYVPAGSDSPSGALDLPGTGEVGAFRAPPVGRWTVEVSLVFGAGRGEARYAWEVTVE